MTFQNILFSFIFLPAVLAVYYVIPARFRNARNSVLFAASLIFYAFAEPAGVLVLLFSVFAGYAFSRTIDDEISRGSERSAARILIYAVGFHVIVFLVFCYLGALLFKTGALTPDSVAGKRLFFPLGMGWYTLRLIGYELDLFRGDTAFDRSVVRFGLAVAFFGALPQGPLLSYEMMAGQTQHRRESRTRFGRGCLVFICGLAKKILIGDQIGRVFAAQNELARADLTVLGAWLGAVTLLLQLYFTLSGMLDMAKGIGMMFGYSFPDGFRYPFSSRSVTEFVRRWNVTLTGWFRKNLYLPLGGDGPRSAQVISIVITCLLFALWHGAGVGFLLFGLYLAFVLILEKVVLHRILRLLPAFVRRLYVFLIMCPAAALFGASQKGGALGYVGAMFGKASAFLNPQSIYYLRRCFWLLVIALIGATPIVRRVKDLIVGKRKNKVSRIAAIAVPAVCVIAILLSAAVKDRTYSVSERRALMTWQGIEWSEVISGDMQEQLKAYAADQFPLRDQFRSLRMRVSRALGEREHNGVYRGSDEYLFEDFTEPSEDILQSQTAAVSAFAEAHPGINTYCILVPTASEILKHKVPAGIPVANEEAYTDAWEEAAGEKVKMVDVSKTLRNHRDEYVYYRTDPNWTSLGAYYAFREAAEPMALDLSADHYESMPVSNDYRGPLATTSGYNEKTYDMISLYFNQDTSAIQVIEYPDTGVLTASPYSSAALETQDKLDVYFGKACGIYRVNTSARAEKKLLVLGDSSTDAFVPFLFTNYREIVVIDPALYSGDAASIVQNEHFTDVLILYRTSNLESDTALARLLNEVNQ